ncbi:TPA: hypothetical protein QC291_005350 [Bacillus cereus]|nr:hypothetical protein [Bacillus cereus]HDR8395445.1 hypothetical protein [Bacillus cereus]HDR8400906.1 hypothetical protein [Bacillus cereus]HDR8406579.1 hypothetical protein [Bacillus cereus]
MKNRPIELVYGTEVFLYDSVHSLSASLSVGMGNLIGMIRKGRGCVHEMHLEFRIVGETEEERIARINEVSGKKEKFVEKKESSNNGRPIEVTFADGAKSSYDSVKDCSASIGVRASSIRTAIRERGGYMPKRQLSFRFLDEE